MLCTKATCYLLLHIRCVWYKDLQRVHNARKYTVSETQTVEKRRSKDSTLLCAAVGGERKTLVEQLAARNYRSISAEVRRALDLYFEIQGVTHDRR